MPFRNQTISTTNLNSTNLYGDLITSGGTDIALFSYNRKLYANTRTYQFGAGAANTEAVLTSFTFPAGTLTSASTIEMFAVWEQISTNSSGKVTRWRFGSAGTTSDSLIWGNSNTTNGTTAYTTWLKLPFYSNTNAHAFTVGPSNLGFQQTSAYAPITGFNLATQTTYLSVCTQRPLLTDVVVLKNCDIFVN